MRTSHLGLIRTVPLVAFATVVVGLSLACTTETTRIGFSPDAGGEGTPDGATGSSSGSSKDAAPENDAATDTPATACKQTGAAIAVKACSGNVLSDGDVPKGCIPNVDGTLHGDEWTDAACFDIGPTDVAYVKYAGAFVYLATISTPACGCPMPFYFDPDGAGAASGNEFGIQVFDDPGNTDGDRSEFKLDGNKLTMSPAPAGIVTKCPGGMPTPIAYEWKLPFAALKINAGTAHEFRMAIVHPMAANWPSTLTLNATKVADDPATWGVLKSSKNWK